jgi:hypothetical protein
VPSGKKVGIHEKDCYVRSDREDRQVQEKRVFGWNWLGKKDD